MRLFALAAAAAVVSIGLNGCTSPGFYNGGWTDGFAEGEPGGSLGVTNWGISLWALAVWPEPQSSKGRTLCHHYACGGFKT
jgi:hypothetical protein